MRAKNSDARRTVKALSELAEAHGYVPGDFIIQRFAEIKARLEGWASFLDDNAVPPELGHLTMREARALLCVEQADLAKCELELMPYFHAKRRAIEATHDMSEETLTLLDVLRNAGPSPGG